MDEYMTVAIIYGYHIYSNVMRNREIHKVDPMIWISCLDYRPFMFDVCKFVLFVSILALVVMRHSVIYHESIAKIFKWLKMRKHSMVNA